MIELYRIRSYIKRGKEKKPKSGIKHNNKGLDLKQVKTNGIKWWKESSYNGSQLRFHQLRFFELSENPS